MLRIRDVTATDVTPVVGSGDDAVRVTRLGNGTTMELLVALDALSPPRAVAQVVSAIACRTHARVRVLTVVTAGADRAAARTSPSGGSRDVVRKRVVSLALAGSCPAAALWPVTIGVGDVVSVIVSEAAAPDTALLVIGLPEPRPFDSLRDNVVKRLLRRVTLPVLAIAPRAAYQPRTVVAAVDFTRASIHAARSALALMAPGSTLHLVHVQSEFGAARGPDNRLRDVYMHGLDSAFERLRGALAAPAGITVECALLEGSPLAEISSYAARVNADLVAVGSHRLESAGATIGRIPAALVRDGSRSVLVAPALQRERAIGVN